MFIPPYDVLLRTLGISQDQLERQNEVSVPVKALKLLIRAAVSGSDVNEAGYIASNPDIADALRKKAITSARDHYVSYGYFEGRRGALRVDEAWYFRTYPDVAAGVRNKRVSSAAEHYASSGAEEFRAPNEASQAECLSWKSVGRP